MNTEAHISANPLAVLKPVKEPRRFTLAEYLNREARSKELHEYFNGIIIKMPMAKGPHNIIVANVTAELILHGRTAEKNYTVFGSQQLVYLPELNFSLYPDVLIVAESPQYWDQNEILLVNPFLVIEVLSKSTRKYDRSDKFDEYKTLPSFKEYVLIDPEQYRVETRFREAADLWRDTIYKNPSDAVVLKSINCSLGASHIYNKIIFK